MSTFLGLPEDHTASAPAVVLLPIPLELTVSYGGGTAAGPDALLAATAQVELFDEDLGFELDARVGFRTALPWDDPQAITPEHAYASIRRYVRHWVEGDALLVALGGEHTITAPILAELKERHGPLTIVQIDAHADLRDTYKGSAYSHACVAKRALDAGHRLIQVGVRALSRPEWELVQGSDEIQYFGGQQVRTDPHWFERLSAVVHAVEGPMYLTLDVDGLDPSVIPGTGTPVPGGLSYQQALDVIDLVTGRGHLVGMDIVELAPIPGQQVSEFAAAKLLVRALTHTLMAGDH